MKRLLLLLGLLVMSTAGTLHAQETLDYYVDEVRGDTLVIKSYADFSPPLANSLIEAIRLDEDPPAGRVYMLQAGTAEVPSLYPLIEQYTFPDREIMIVGEYCGEIVQGEDPDCRPPIISGFLTADEEPVNSNLLNTNSDLTYKNLAILPASPDGGEGWTFTEVTGEDVTVTLDNVLGEHNNWTWVQSNSGIGTSLIIRDSYFLNATGVATRRNGGIYDSTGEPLDTLWVENTTHVNNAGMQYKFRNFPANKAFFNHNTFANVSGNVFLSFGYQTNFTVVNNLFSNSNVQAYWPGLDLAETDPELQPHGIINLSHIPDGSGIGVADEERMVLVDLNGVYWDERLDQIVETIEDRGWTGDVCSSAGCLEDGEWMTQMITANAETQSIFENEERYPLITGGDWIMAGAPDFERDPEDVDPTIFDAYIEWNVETVRSDNTTLLAKLRTPGNPAENINMLLPDWPVAVDLTYSNDVYLDAALGGYPLGDLNWFPELKAEWLEERDELYERLEAALTTGTRPVAVEPIGGETPSSTLLKQNFPNPFTGATTIEFELGTAGDVELEVYDVLGRRVAKLVDEGLTAGAYSVEWDGRDVGGQLVSNGVYFYTLRAGESQETRRMVFLK